MKPISSPLRILDFAVMRMDFEFIPPANSVRNEGLFDRYEVDLDFDVFKNGILQIVMTVDINTGENPQPGYKISAEVASLFKFDGSAKISSGEKESMEGFSTVYIALNNLRGFISGFTANAPFGRYILPSIDLNDLILKKRTEVEQYTKIKRAEQKEKKVKQAKTKVKMKQK
jgi:preprotein translocase subunit SecB